MIDRFQSFVTGVTVCYKYIQRIKTTEMTEFGLKGTHVMCMFFLYHNSEGLTAAQLCQLCAEDKAAISRSLSTLQEKGFIRSEGGRYRALLHLTESGAELASRMDGLIGQWVNCGGDGLSDGERAEFYRVLDHITRNLRRAVDGGARTPAADIFEKTTVEGK